MNQESSKITTEDIYALLKEINNNLSEKIEKLEEEVKSVNKVTQTEVEELKQKIIFLENENSELKDKVEKNEKKLKTNNLVLYGLTESSDESNINLIKHFLTLVNTSLEVILSESEIGNIFRIGKKEKKNRPLLVSLVSYVKKREILANCRKLKGKKIFITEDFTEKELEERKVLVAALKQARRDNKTARIEGTKLMIDGKVYVSSEIKSQQILDTEDNYPSQIQINSESLGESATSSTEDIYVDGDKKVREKKKEIKPQKLKKSEDTLKNTTATRSQTKLNKFGNK